MGFAIDLNVCTILRLGTATDTDSCRGWYVVQLTHVLGVKAHTDIVQHSYDLEPSLARQLSATLKIQVLPFFSQGNILSIAGYQFEPNLLGSSILARTCSEAPKRKQQREMAHRQLTEVSHSEETITCREITAGDLSRYARKAKIPSQTDLFPSIGNEGGSVAVRHLSFELIGFSVQVRNAKPNCWELV